MRGSVAEARFSPKGSGAVTTSPDGRFTLLLDAEIETPEDVLTAVAAHGNAAIERLRGGFALALWDADKRTLVLARDPIGMKPLYFATAPGRLAFASDVWTLAAAGFVEKRLSKRAIASFLATGSVVEPDTILEGVSPLPPATILTYHEGRARTSTYWEIPIEPRSDVDLRDVEATFSETEGDRTTSPLAPDEREISNAIEALDQPSTSFLHALRAAKSAREAAFTGLGKDALFPAASRVLHFGALLAAGNTVERAYATLRSTSQPDEVRSLVSPDIAEETWLPITIPEKLEPSLARRRIRLDRALAALDLANDLRDTALRDADLASRRHGLTPRAPLLDRAVVERALCLPLRSTFLHTRARPAPAPPLAAWLKGPLRPWAKRLLQGEATRNLPFLDAAAVSRLWRDFLADDRGLGAPRVFVLTTLVAYLQSHDASI